MHKLCVGVDVGGTNTDVAILQLSKVVGWAKVNTTEDVTDGVKSAIDGALRNAALSLGKSVDLIAKDISRVNIGTTHFINAVIKRHDLAKVSVVRLCGPASLSVPPFTDFPADLRELVDGGCHFLAGGYEYDGSEITPLSQDEITSAVNKISASGLRHVVVAGIFSPVQPQQELNAREYMLTLDPTLSITLSHELGQMGLLERENASILNESLKPLAKLTIRSFKEALKCIGLTCPFYLTQNDGTIISESDALKYPVHTFSSGATNSMRGAAFLSGLEDAIVIDIGGTSSDIGVLHQGFPREASTRVKIGGVNTNFRMPDVLSIGLGGGSIVRKRESDGKVCIGPDSVGYKLKERAVVFGGETLTASDVAVALGLADFGDKSLLVSTDTDFLQQTHDTMRAMLESGIDQMKVSQGDTPVCLVGGGSVMVDITKPLQGVSKLEKPPYYQVANAVGAALGQISGSYDRLVSFTSSSRNDVIEKAKAEAIKTAVAAGALAETIKILDITETSMSYVTVPVTRLKIKVVGDLYNYDTKVDLQANSQGVQGSPCNFSSKINKETEKALPAYEEDGKALHEQSDTSPLAPHQSHKTENDICSPTIDPDTGEWFLSRYDVECCTVGCGILGCGGGGSPYLARLMALRAIEEGKQLRVLNPMRLRGRKGRILPVAFMGAPVVLTEKIARGSEVMDACNALTKILRSELPEKYLTSEGDLQLISDVHSLPSLSLSNQEENLPIAIMSGEIGGINGIIPLLVGAKMGLPVVDCDGMGRAFPKLNDFGPFIFGCSPTPSVLANEKGSVAAVAHASSPQALEDHFRIKTIQFGCIAGLALGSLTSEELINKSCLYSISRAWRIGNSVLNARRLHTSPVNAILEQENGQLILSGKIIDVRRVTEKGFNFGHVLVEGTDNFKGRFVRIDFQNENLIVRDENNGRVLVTCPDLITLVDTDLGNPVMTEDARYGLRVSVLVLPIVPLMKREEALKQVGPQAFGYKDISYASLCDFVEREPIPP